MGALKFNLDEIIKSLFQLQAHWNDAVVESVYDFMVGHVTLLRMVLLDEEWMGIHFSIQPTKQ